MVKVGQGEVGLEPVDRVSLRLRIALQLGRSAPHQGWDKSVGPSARLDGGRGAPHIGS